MIYKTVAIVGAGFSGSLLAINILRHAGPEATLIERRPVFGRGTAYTAPHPSHLLNVRAGNMSALSDRPQHFAEWCTARGLGGGGDFAQRKMYGEYLGELLERSNARAGERLHLVRDDVVGSRVDDDGVTLSFAEGPPQTFDALVVAVGNLPPHAPPGLDPDSFTPDLYAHDPWDPRLIEGLTDDDTILLIGTGLTMVDVALSLDAAGFGGKIVAMSRRGLLPRPHVPPGPAGDRNEKPTSQASALLHEIRVRTREIGWRAAVDEMRPFTQSLWLSASVEERSRFLRHLRPWWDVHRHRLAPAVAATIERMRARGQLSIVAGKPSRFEASGTGIDVGWRPRGASELQTLHARRVVNCTGPQGDLARSTEPLLRGLIASGHARADANRLGLDVDSQSRLVGADGTPHPRLFGLGPMTRGAFWEIVAVPDIRTQVWTVARRLAQAHWVGGEGL
ncbi:FAD/NAD(P)-binding protein [Glacieibacterium sp.]|uniref:FAD/NAD(P)-binding protein n=1 Tax=Glacieibacterium sp. TaxID=2860237 RepID=UPI003B007C35